jgi:hypothetical protein
MKKVGCVLLIITLLALVSCATPESQRWQKALLPVAQGVLENVATSYGDRYSNLVHVFFEALKEPISSASGTSYPAPTQGYGASAPSYQQLEVYFDLVKEVSVGGSQQAQSVADGETLTQNDNYKVTLQSNLPCYIYIAQLDSTGKLDPIFPSQHAAGSNPVQPYTPYSVPEGNQWFFLDQNSGIETIYFIASRDRRSDIEEMFYTFQNTNPSLVQQQNVQMNTYYAMKRGIGGAREGGSREVQFQDGSQGQYMSTLITSIQADFVMTRYFYHQ